MRILVGLAVTFVSMSNAAAGGETSPMIGGSFIAGGSPDTGGGVAGAEVEAAFWYDWIGLAVEAAAQTPLGDGAATKAAAVGGSLRLQAIHGLVPSLMDSSDVEAAVELQGIVQRVVWSEANVDREPYVWGVGLALRLRGATDDDVPRLIAESRFFLRVLWSRPEPEMSVARTVSSSMPPQAPRDVMILFGVGGAFGGGERRYLGQFLPQPL